MAKRSRISVWWQAFRYHFVPPSIFPATLGALVAWAVDRSFFSFFFLLVLVGVVVNHVALNMADDYFDYEHAVDQVKSGEKNPYSGGSGTLSNGLIKPKTMFKAFSACFIITVAIGLYLTVARGFPVLLFGLFGVFCSIFYTAPPVSFSHYGLGEVGQLICFGSIIGLGSYYVQAQKLSLAAFVATLPLGIMLFSMIVINEIPDYEEDRLAGKFTLVARYGKSAGVKLYTASWICTYLVIICGSLLGAIPLIALIALVSLPLAINSVRVLNANHEDPVKLAPANLSMIQAHSVTSFGLIIAFAIQGLLNGSSLAGLVLILVALTVAYAPAGYAILKPRKS